MEGQSAVLPTAGSDRDALVVIGREVPVVETTQQARSSGLAELRSWYLDSLRPKLAGAASAGSVAPAAAAALDVQLRDLLGLSGEYEEAA